MKLTDVLDETNVAHTLHRDEFIESYLIEVKLKCPLHQIKSMLNRIGIVNEKEKKVVQIAHILVSRGKFYLGHFKMFLQMQGNECEILERDMGYLVSVINNLVEWGKIELVEPHAIDVKPRFDCYKVVKINEVSDWNFVKKFTFRKRENKNENSTKKRLSTDQTSNSGKQNIGRDSSNTKRRDNNPINRNDRGNGPKQRIQGGREGNLRSWGNRVRENG